MRLQVCCDTTADVHSLVADEIDRASHVDINKVNTAVLLYELSCAGEGVREAATQLHTKHVFARVALEQGPLRALPLQQVCRQGHFTTRDICPQTFADAPV